MWTYTTTITPVENSTMMAVTIAYSKGAETVTLQTTLSTEREVKDAIKANLQRLVDRDAVIKSVADGTFTIEEAVDVPTPISLEEEAKRALEANRAILQTAKSDVELGLLTQAEYDAKVSAMKATKQK